MLALKNKEKNGWKKSSKQLVNIFLKIDSESAEQNKDTLMSTIMTKIPDEKLIAMADKYHTPLYVFEEAVIRNKCSELKTAITYPRTVIRYACKALTLQAILKIIREEGLWIDA